MVVVGGADIDTGFVLIFFILYLNTFEYIYLYVYEYVLKSINFFFFVAHYLLPDGVVSILMATAETTYSL